MNAALPPPPPPHVLPFAAVVVVLAEAATVAGFDEATERASEGGDVGFGRGAATRGAAGAAFITGGLPATVAAVPAAASIGRAGCVGEGRYGRKLDKERRESAVPRVCFFLLSGANRFTRGKLREQLPMVRLRQRTRVAREGGGGGDEEAERNGLCTSWKEEKRKVKKNNCQGRPKARAHTTVCGTPATTEKSGAGEG